MMKRRTTRTRALSALLTLALLLTLVPTAFAASCPKGGSHTVESGKWEIIREANCHEKGVRRGKCTKCEEVIYEDIEIRSNNHDAVCTDNGDGRTHTATCPYHPDTYSNKIEEHTFVNGRCTKCLAVDYGAVKLSLPKDLERYIAIDDEEAELSLGDVSLLLGSADVTDDYNLAYNWYYEGKSIGSGETYELPASVIREEGDYTYVCFVMAYPKRDPSSKPISASCTVTVRVRTLITASAMVSSEDVYMDLGDTNSRTPIAVSEQIYDAVYDVSTGEPDYVVFGTKPVSKAGKLDCGTGKYYFDASNNQNDLDDVRFEPDAENTGIYVINFTVFDTKGKSFPGTLTFTVEQSLGDLDVLLVTTKGEAVDLDSEDFQDFWLNTYSQGELSRVTFTSLPAASKGVFYYGYTSASRPGTRVKADDSFYIEPTSKQEGLDGVTFVPDSRFSGYVSIPFEAYGVNNRGKQTYLDGDLCVFVSDGEVEDVICTTTGTDVTELDAEDFLEVYQDAVDSKSTGFYIQLLEAPASGTLYVNYTGGSRDTKLTDTNVADYPLYYSNTRGDEIGDVSYLPGKASTDEVRYVAYDAKGEMRYIGRILFRTVRSDLSISYTAPSAGVSFKSSDFTKVLGISGEEAYLTFTQPASGTLYFSKTGSASDGVQVKTGDKYYLEYDLMSVSNLIFVPKAGQTGVVSIPFTAYDEDGVAATGTVKITIQSQSVGYTRSFTDVKKSDWFYTPVMDLAEAKIIDGVTPTTFNPSGEVTYGQALKLILLAAGYPKQVEPAGNNWAVNYLKLAQSEGILTQNVDLSRKITRYAIAEMAAKAMRLPKPTSTQSPFTDMTMNNPAAPFVLALYEAGIVGGTEQADGTYKYYGVNSIIRSEFAKIIWGINNYMAD